MCRPQGLGHGHLWGWDYYSANHGLPFFIHEVEVLAPTSQGGCEDQMSLYM